jgi:hypothetical protein
MKSLFVIILAIALAGCSSQPKTIVSQDLEDGVVGAKPEGYPKTMVKALPDQPGFCVEVTESWQEHDHEGQTVWLKEKKVQSIACTKDRWRRLSMDRY